MKLSALAKRNLHGDRNVQGKQWKTAVDGYWHSAKSAKDFIRLCRQELNALPDAPRVLELGSADGFLGESVCAYLRSKGKRPHLTLVDMSKAHLRENKHKHTRKIQADLLTLNLTKTAGHFDLILMRSVLHYFPSAELQIQVLKRVRRHLAHGGVFLNQAFIAATPEESKLRSASRATTRKVGLRYMPYHRDVPRFYAKAGFTNMRNLGDMPLVHPSLASLIRRSDLTRADIQRTRARYALVPARLRPHLTLTKTAFKRTIPYKVYAATRPPSRLKRA
ncbi:Methyltransferase domain protein [uncultured archaeon]|nr:Methyltransferase domain protein [uncultured archaeon]